MIVVDDLCIRVGGIRVIKNFTLSVKSGEMTLLIGTSELVLQGILSAICGQVPAEHGKIEIEVFELSLTLQPIGKLAAAADIGH